MKSKAYVLVFVLLALTFFITPYVYAEPYWRSVTVNKVATDQYGEVTLTLDCPLASGGTKRIVLSVPDGEEKNYLAVALTALSSGLEVEAYVDIWSDVDLQALRLLGP